MRTYDEKSRVSRVGRFLERIGRAMGHYRMIKDEPRAAEISDHYFVLSPACMCVPGHPETRDCNRRVKL